MYETTAHAVKHLILDHLWWYVAIYIRFAFVLSLRVAACFSPCERMAIIHCQWKCWIHIFACGRSVYLWLSVCDKAQGLVLHKVCSATAWEAIECPIKCGGVNVFLALCLGYKDLVGADCQKPKSARGTWRCFVDLSCICVRCYNGPCARDTDGAWEPFDCTFDTWGIVAASTQISCYLPWLIEGCIGSHNVLLVKKVRQGWYSAQWMTL